MNELLEITNLSICFNQGQKAVDSLSLSLQPGETLALVGESGSGKSVTALSILRLLDERHASYPSGEIRYRDEDLLQASVKRMRQVRGREISMIFQEPMTS
ncbi:ATP-binding cassette domain-containing protein, partial [Marinobacter sp.]